ncbi:MAG: trypsin-like serine protease [Pseudomonadota bacterium]
MNARLLLWFVALLVAVSPAHALDLDRLRMLTIEEHVPWRGVGRVNIANFSERGMCTGTLISEELVLTAAHCVVSAQTGKVHKLGNIHFVAGWRQGQRAGHSQAKEVIVHSDYDPFSQSDLDLISSDLAVIKLENPIPEQSAPYFLIAAAPRTGSPLTIISYRRDRAHALTRQRGCKILGEKDSVMAVKCEVTFGASGSPLFAEIDGEERLVGVVSAMSRSEGRAIAWAVRVDEGLVDAGLADAVMQARPTP